MLRLLASTEALRQEVQVGIDQAERGEVIDHGILSVVYGVLKL